MTVKEQLLHRLDQLPEPMLYKVLDFVEALQSGENSIDEDEVWQAYLTSEQERQEVYRRLASS